LAASPLMLSLKPEGLLPVEAAMVEPRKTWSINKSVSVGLYTLKRRVMEEA